jgi:hypothetical protein
MSDVDDFQDSSDDTVDDFTAEDASSTDPSADVVHVSDVSGDGMLDTVTTTLSTVRR